MRRAQKPGVWQISYRGSEKSVVADVQRCFGFRLQGFGILGFRALTFLSLAVAQGKTGMMSDALLIRTRLRGTSL